MDIGVSVLIRNQSLPELIQAFYDEQIPKPNYTLYYAFNLRHFCLAVIVDYYE